MWTQRWRLGLVIMFLLVGSLAACGDNVSHPPVGPSLAPVPSAPTSSSATAAITFATRPPGTASPVGVSTPTPITALVLNGVGTAFTAPSAPTVKTAHGTVDIAGGDTCGGLFDTGFEGGDCQMASSALGSAVALSERQGLTERTLVYALAGDRATLVLRRVRTLPTSTKQSHGYGAETLIRASDINHDGIRALVILTPSSPDTPDSTAADVNQTYPPLDSLDVVQTSGLVGLHRDLDGGEAHAAPAGGIECFTPDGAGMAHDTVITYDGRHWHITSDTVIATPTAAPSAGDF